ncbi:MAG: glutamate--tRNA ligase [bacterium]|nr:glutamate--tRNA ligase [bacterium]
MSRLKQEKGSVRVRFAPSPTGHLHIGSLRTALFNYLFARHYNGAYLLRIEDTDLERSKAEYTRSIFSTLKWIGLEPDEPVIIQSERINEHKKVVDQLMASGKAYRCYCSQEQVMVRHQERHPGDPFVKYDGFCRNKQKGEYPNEPYAIRFALPTDRDEVVFDDIIRGRVAFPLNQLDDFIIVRSDGSPMYNFVVVVDDAFMNISHVIRGEDHISNTPKQIVLYEACGYEIPQFAHVPFILGPSGDRLSKRDAATSALEYCQLGYLPDALVNYLVRLGWSHGDQEVFSRQELIEYFSLDQVGKKGAIFDINKLQWLNSVYLKEKTAADLYAYILTYINPDFSNQLAHWDENHIFNVIELYKDRVHTLAQLAQEIVHLYKGPDLFDEHDVKKWVDAQALDFLKELLIQLESLDDDAFSTVILSEMVKNFAKVKEAKLVTIAQPLRIALIGKSSGPGVFELLSILGKKECLRRLHAFHENMRKA